jgi:hypothetical protein
MVTTFDGKTQATALLEPKPVAKKSTGKHDDKPKRSRARDLGAVIALGVEIDADLHEAFEAGRAAKKWSKRTLVEEALKAYLQTDGFWPQGGPKGKGK